MSNPSASIEQLDAMRMGVDYRFPVTCRHFTVTCRPLTIGENNEIYGRVMEAMAKVPQTQRTALREHSILAIETLVKATTSDHGVNDPRITEFILERMTNEEVQFLFKQYVAGCDRANPCLEEMDAAQLKELVEEVKKKDPSVLASRLIELSFLELVNVSRSLILGE